jgi:hypothetical protein
LPRSGTYNLFNPSCAPSQDKVFACAQNWTLVSQPPPQTPLPPCPTGTYTAGQCYPYWAPMQITRTVAVKDQPNQVTALARAQLPTNSVFNYYRLIDVQLPGTPAQIGPGAQAPLSTGGITPPSSSYIVANTTMETFVQSKNSCMDCHQHASIGQPKAQTFSGPANHLTRRVLLTSNAKAGGAPRYASDYSFLFSTETRH